VAACMVTNQIYIVERTVTEDLMVTNEILTFRFVTD